MKINFAEPGLPSAGTIITGVFEERVLGVDAADLDKRTNGAVTRAMAASCFTGKAEQFLVLLAPPNLTAHRIVLAGLGKLQALNTTALQALGGNIYHRLAGTGETEAALLFQGIMLPNLKPAQAVAEIAFGFRLRGYRFDKYRTTLKPEQLPTLDKFTIRAAGAVAARKAYASLDKVADGVFFARDLVSEPANILYPETLADAAKTLTELGVEVDILDEKKLKKHGLNALLAVGRGSRRPPRLIVMHWHGAGDKHAAPIALIGKGITFDTGGISIKPAAGMEDMKWDMAGAGAVIGAMHAIAGRKAKVNVVGVVAAAENMPDGDATRPGDIVKSMSGQTIEINNTDAEGRLVLADALWYAQERFKPRVMVDAATLTGAIIIALGSEHAGLYANDETLAIELDRAGKDVGEKLWRMPLAAAYNKLIDSDAADVKNISGGREAGSIIAAQFLQRFVNGTKWAHLDIAGMAWSKRDTATVPKGATAFGVRLFDRFITISGEI